MSAIQPRLWALIQKYARQYRLDPHAVAAVSLMEGGGRFGAIGDSGTSYGPFQLHRGGALPAGKGAAWANSPAGVAYAMRSMARAGAAGLHGPAAISVIVRQFERPADPASEIAGAVSRYGSLRKQLRGGGAALGGVPGHGMPMRGGAPVTTAMPAPIQITPQPLNFVAPTVAATSGLPGIPSQGVQAPGNLLAEQGASLNGQLAEIRRRLLA